MENIYIYHTNDLHSHFEHWPRIKEFLLKRKNLHEETGESVFLFDIGDHMDRWHPLSDATRGKANTELLNEGRYDAVTIGNNEGITLPYDDLDSMYEEAQFQVLLANLYKSDESRPSWAEPYHIYVTTSGVRVGVIGVTAFYPNFYNSLGWQIKDPIEEVGKQMEVLRSETDIIILLSHLGLNDDEQIAERFPEIDVILGGHTHHILHEGNLVNECLLGAAGKFGMYVGQLVLSIDKNSKQVVKKKAILFDVNELHPVVDENEQIHNLYSRGKSLLNNPIEATKIESGKKEFLARMLCDAMFEWCNVDCALLNEGLILQDLDAKDISMYDLLRTCPHPINPCVVELSGAELREVLLETLEQKWKDYHLKGLGFRGTLIGKFIHTGVKFVHKGQRIQIKVSDQPLDKDRVYRLAIPDMFTFGRFFPEIHRAKYKKYFLPEFMRDILRWALQNSS